MDLNWLNIKFIIPIFSCWIFLCKFNFIQSVGPPVSAHCRDLGYDKVPLLLINMDGFSPKYFEYPESKNLTLLASKGVMAPYMRPVYPTKTFPNLYSMVTGLYPDKHGIVDNHFKDPETGTEFYHSKIETQNIKWGGEPIWVTAKKNGIRSMVRHWPGSQIVFNGIAPDSLSKPGRTTNLNNARLAFDMLKDGRNSPGFMTLYFNEPDHAAHKFGPGSAQVRKAIKDVSMLISRIINGLYKQRRLECVNIIIVSDHGGYNTPCSGLVFLDQIAQLGHVSFLAGPSVMILPFKSKLSPTEIFDKMRCSRGPAAGKYEVYKKTHMPRRHHYSSNNRIGDIVVKMREGTNMFRYSKRPPPCEKFKGGHGYDDGLPPMQGVFFAFGPSFKKSTRIAPFQNIELYNLMAALLGVTPAPNDGTFGLLADALVIPHEPTPPSTQSVKYYELLSSQQFGSPATTFRNNKPVQPAGNFEGGYSDEGYESGEEQHSPWAKRDLFNTLKDKSFFFHNVEKRSILDWFRKKPKEKDLTPPPQMNEITDISYKVDDKDAGYTSGEEDYYGTGMGVGTGGVDTIDPNLERMQPIPIDTGKATRKPTFDDDIRLLPPAVSDFGGPTSVSGPLAKCCSPVPGSVNLSPLGSNDPPQGSPVRSALVSHSGFGIPKSSLVPLSILPSTNYVIGYDEQNGYPAFASYVPSEPYSKDNSPGDGNCIGLDGRIVRSGDQLNACKNQLNLRKNMIPVVPLKLYPGSDGNIMSNVVFVYEDFYNNIWAPIMATMTNVALKHKALLIVGPVFDFDGNNVRDDMSSVKSYVDNQKIPIPSHLFIATFYCRTGGTNCDARNTVINSFLIPHVRETENCETPDEYFRKHYIRVKDIEQLTGLNFFLKYPEHDRIKLTTHFYLNLDKKKA